jgi:CRP-like cAMP-binding protein
VPEVLESCIRQRYCPALRDFYDLILKAHQAGILRSEELGAEGPAQANSAPIQWFLSLPAGVAKHASWVAALATLTAFVLRPPTLPSLLEALIGWAAVCGALSLGQILAASVLAHAGGEIYRPHFKRATLAPHFAVDLCDLRMVPGPARAAVHLATLLPLALTTATGLFLGAGWSLVPLVSLLFACRPVGGSVVQHCLLLRRRQPLLSTDAPRLFAAKLSFAEYCRKAWRRFDGRVAALQLTAAVCWAAMLGFTAYHTQHLDPARTLLDASIWLPVLSIMGAALAAILLWWIANAVQYDIIDSLAAAWRHGQVEWRRWRANQQALVDGADAEMLIRRNPLLRRLDPEIQAELAQYVRPFTVGARRTILGFDEDPPFVGLILSGRATVYHRLPSGRKKHFLSVLEGDLFGAHKLVGAEFSNLEIRTNTPFCALVIDSAEFKRLVVDSLTVAVVRNYVHKHLFLQRGSPICAEWRPTAVARFAELTSTATHAAGGKIIRRGEEVGNLFVLYHGRARALNGRKSLGRIEPGDFFGEISLLQTSPAMADVETNEESRSLVVNRIEFIRFMSRNHHVALQMERLCSKRLGRPIFPMDGGAFV